MKALRRRGPDDQALPAARARARHPDPKRTSHMTIELTTTRNGEVAAWARRFIRRLCGSATSTTGSRPGSTSGSSPTTCSRTSTSAITSRTSSRTPACPTITIKKNKNEVEVNIHTARPGIVIGKSGSEVDALRRELHRMTGKAGQGQHPRDQAPGARRQARRAVDRRAAPEPRRLPARDEARADQRDALGRQGREDPGVRPPRRRRDGAHRGLLGRPRAAAHAARRHRLRLLRGPHHLRPHRREGLDQQGRDHAQGLRAGPDRARGARRPSGPAAAVAVRAAAVPAAVGGGGGRGPGGGGRGGRGGRGRGGRAAPAGGRL